MINNITVCYIMNGTEVFVPIAYQIDVADDIQTVICTISRTDNAPSWLQLYKFELKSQLHDGVYTQLYANHENVKNIDTMLFIDKVYEDIMAKEKCKLAVV